MAKDRITSGQEGCFDSTIRRIVDRNFPDISWCTTQFDAVTGTTGATLTNVVGMVTDSISIAPGNYRFRIHLSTVATSNSGLKVGLKFGTASMLTSIESVSRGFTASGVAVQHSTTATDAASLFASTTAVINCVIEGTMVVALAGTLQLQAAQNAAHADTTSVYTGSYMMFTRMGA